MFRIPCLVLCFVAVSHQFSVSKFEVPDAIELGSEAELKCEHDAKVPFYVKWWWSSGKDKPLLLYQRLDNEPSFIKPNTKPAFNITLKSPDLDNIVIWDLKPEHSGTFTCEVVEDETVESRKAEDLVVYTVGSGPLLNTTKFEDDEAVQVTCEAVGVAPEPDLTISIDSKTFNATVLHGPEDGLYNVFANTTMTEDDLEGQEISCKLSFKDAENVTSDMMVSSDIYHSDAWVASTAAPDDTTDPAALAAPVPLLPGSSGRAGASWLVLATLLIPATIALL